MLRKKKTTDDTAKPIMLFNLLGHKLGTGFAYSVYSVEGIAPTILTMTGGADSR